MLKFQSTSVYQESLRKLSNNYNTIMSDIRGEFSALSFEDIFAKKYVLKDSGIEKILKVRIANSEQNKGKSSGFRIFLIADSRTSEVTFLNIFAKTGADGKDNIDKEEIKESLSRYKSEKKSNTLVELDPKDSFNIKGSIS
jgi:mRNA-degrading endonuclease RelE of RelBE toxin-antitoxin system